MDEQSALAVRFEGPAFQRHFGLEATKSAGLGDFASGLAVQVVWVVLPAPGVEVPVDCENGVVFQHESRAKIANPAIVGGDIDQFDVIAGAK